MAVSEKAVTETTVSRTAVSGTDTFPDALGDTLAATALVLARALHAGATLWCLGPSWPQHARHLAVEFVHPVVVGARALPAVAVVDDDPVATLRALARADDVVVAIGDATDPTLGDALRRAPAWGLTTIWIGAGPTPAPATGVADRVLWLAQPTGEAFHDGRLVLLYHVLWELTHVCFEHPGLLAAAPDEACAGGACAVCRDQGVVAEVVRVEEDGIAVVRTARGLESVDASLVAPIDPHDLVLLHAGTALAVLP
jgi:hypothetical protein